MLPDRIDPAAVRDHESVPPRRGTVGMDAAEVLPTFTGVAVHDAWAPYDCYRQAVHALCNAHVPRELVHVTDTTAGAVADLAAQTIDALATLKTLTDTARDGDQVLDAEAVEHHTHRPRPPAPVRHRRSPGGRR
jgi:hypothetical protein